MSNDKSTSSILMEDMRSLNDSPEAQISPECRRRWRAALPDKRRPAFGRVWSAAFAAAVLCLYLFGGTAVWRNMDSVGRARIPAAAPTAAAAWTGTPSPTMLYAPSESAPAKNAVPADAERFAVMEESAGSALFEDNDAWDASEFEEIEEAAELEDAALPDSDEYAFSDVSPGGACTDTAEEPKSGSGYFSDMKAFLSATWPYALAAAGLTAIVLFVLSWRKKA